MTLRHRARVRVYMDHNATTPLCVEAGQAMAAWLTPGAVANASSVHAEGRSAREAVESARAAVALAIGAASPKEVIFTSGATEANNTVLRAAGGAIVTSAIEHVSVLDAARALGDVTAVGVGGAGRLDLYALDAALRFEPALCSIIWANNETGVIQDVMAIAELCRKRDVPCHLDGAQALGKIDLSVEDVGCDFATFSAHKVNGPLGCGALYVRKGATLSGPLLAGGHQERGRRAGTENVAAIAGFGAAARRVSAVLDRMDMVASLRDRLRNGLVELGMIAVGEGADRLPNTLSVRLPSVDGETLLMAFDLAGVSVSAGSACTAGSLEPSHVLLAMGLDEEDARGAIRLSLGPGNTVAEVERVLLIAQEIVRRVQVVRGAA